MANRRLRFRPDEAMPHGFPWQHFLLGLRNQRQCTMPTGLRDRYLFSHGLVLSGMQRGQGATLCLLDENEPLGIDGLNDVRDVIRRLRPAPTTWRTSLVEVPAPTGSLVRPRTSIPDPRPRHHR
jgi:hypothetical protein